MDHPIAIAHTMNIDDDKPHANMNVHVLDGIDDVSTAVVQQQEYKSIPALIDHDYVKGCADVHLTDSDSISSSIDQQEPSVLETTRFDDIPVQHNKQPLNSKGFKVQLKPSSTVPNSTDKRGKGSCAAVESTALMEKETYDFNGFKFCHSDYPKLIVNLYCGEKNGFTVSAYIPETDKKPARILEESALARYKKSDVIECINTETLPIKFLTRFQELNGISLFVSNGRVICELRDYRQNCSGPTPVKLPPVIRHVVLRPTAATLQYDFDQIFKKSFAAAEKHNQLLPEKDRIKPTLTLEQRHELEKKFIKATAPSLCLNPSKEVASMANLAQHEKFKWNAPELIRAVKKMDAKYQKLKKAQEQVEAAAIAGGTKSKKHNQDDNSQDDDFVRGKKYESFFNFVEKVKLTLPRDSIDSRLANLVYKEPEYTMSREDSEKIAKWMELNND